MASLTNNDARVLNALFDAESSLSSATNVIPLPSSLPQIEEDRLQSIQCEEARILKALSVNAPAPETIISAIDGLTTLLERNPQYAPAYVNRAQARRMVLGDHDLTSIEREAVSSIHEDLTDAIKYARASGNTQAVSPLQASTLSAAYTHRGHLYYHIARSGDLSCLPDHLRELGPQLLEELASADFRMGGKYGNTIAQQLSVRTNPYAKMCGAIVREALQQELAAQSLLSFPDMKGGPVAQRELANHLSVLHSTGASVL